MDRQIAIGHESSSVSQTSLSLPPNSGADISRYSPEEEAAFLIRRERRMESTPSRAGSFCVHIIGLIKTAARGLIESRSPPLIDEWFQRAADDGDAPAQAYLGRAYYDGLCVAQDFAQASAWFRKAAAQGNAVGQLGLGKIYQHGQGVPQDYAQAAVWFRKAAERGNIAAQAALGGLYAEGQGVPKDYEQAAVWLHKAAEQGDPGAQIHLGCLCLQARGVPQDFEQATLWFSLASRTCDAAIGNLALRLRDDAAAHLTPAQMAEVEQKANLWNPRWYTCHLA